MPLTDAMGIKALLSDGRVVWPSRVDGNTTTPAERESRGGGSPPSRNCIDVLCCKCCNGAKVLSPSSRYIQGDELLKSMTGTIVRSEQTGSNTGTQSLRSRTMRDSGVAEWSVRGAPRRAHGIS